jgi:hypothetical protein
VKSGCSLKCMSSLWLVTQFEVQRSKLPWQEMGLFTLSLIVFTTRTWTPNEHTESGASYLSLRLLGRSKIKPSMGVVHYM